ncbi:MBL fold metallo-hydrolase [Gracilibacillus alcaliphilus]|uniref:MBL fold metallo-hydrolase n=1 Tax=Gracilibacillus alcaliphilus TaxID=1401441 RepID=UPI00195DE19B|nr:MBL fold metallo-hydrolase [Gracilibacillus alcaliphilus]MBM7679230.1 ribonuclease J [Gracilibacillus alcaliphilus]
MQQTTITFWGGLNTIGGNIAEITYGEARVIFDFGLVYDPGTSFVQNHKNRQQTYVSDLLKLGAIPPIDGIYAESDIQTDDFPAARPLALEETDKQTAVFISHLHLDHMGAMDTIADAIPVYMSEQSKELFEHLQVIGEGLTRPRQITGIEYQQAVQIGEITVTLYQTDHDAYGSAAMLIKTPDLNILYSGDIRMHGQHPEYNLALIQAMKDISIDILLMEGTAFRPVEPESDEDKRQAPAESEQEIASYVGERLLQHTHLGIFNMYHRNVDRINNIIEAGRRANRQVVLETKTAYLANYFAAHRAFSILLPKNKKLAAWEEELIKKYPTVTTAEINQNPALYFVQNSFDHLVDLLDLQVQGALYFHANGMPLGAFDPQYYALLKYLEHFQIHYQSINVSGHATKKDILALIDAFHPALLIPWHSLYPELVQPNNPKQAVFIPEKTSYYMENGMLHKMETY